MRNCIVWVFINHENWEPYYFDTLESANKFIENNELDYDSLEIIELKER